MNQIDVKRFGLACGTTFALLYLGCVLVMAVAGRQTTVFFFNSLMHGLDTSPILRMNVPLWEAGIGMVETFILAWLIGAAIAAVYNVSSRPRSE